jgi:hypothetical protein
MADDTSSETHHVHHGTLHKEKIAWYKRWWGIIVVIGVWPFFLLWFTWAKAKWAKPVKLAATIVAATGVIFYIAIGAVGGQGTTPRSKTSSASSSSNGTLPVSNSAPATAQQTYKVGDTITFDGLAVTLANVTDPAKPASTYDTADAGKRLVATAFTIQNNGTDTYNDDANNNVTVIGSDNQAYTAMNSSGFIPVIGCTNFSSGMYTLVDGQSESGCVVVQMPLGVSIKGVKFQDDGGFGNGGQWKLSS